MLGRQRLFFSALKLSHSDLPLNSATDSLFDIVSSPYGNAEKGHDRITHELVHYTSMAVNNLTHAIKIAVQHVYHL